MAAYLMSERTAAFVRRQMARQGAVPDGAAGATRRSRPAFARGSEYAAPYTVRWAASVGDEGAWIVWLPSDSLLVVDGAAVDVREGLEAAGGDYPEGWYRLDALPSEGGTLVLAVADGAATFSVASDGNDTAGGFAVTVCTAMVDADTGARRVKQFVSSVLVVGSGEGGGKYGADEFSVSLINRTEGETVTKGNIFHLTGFGRFVVDGQSEPYGSFAPSSTLDVADGDETKVAFLVRTGNKDEPGANFLGYKTIRFSSSRASAFACVRGTKISDGLETATYKLVNCYWNVGGITHRASDQDITTFALAGGFVYAAFGIDGKTLSIGSVASLDSLNELQKDAENYVIPLYKFSGGSFVDLRTAPQVQMFEGGLT